MSSDIDINDCLWMTVRSGSFELNIDCDGDIMCVSFDLKDSKQRDQLKFLKSAIQHSLNTSTTHMGNL